MRFRDLTICAAIVLALAMSATVGASVLVSDDFSYSDGSLVGNTPAVGGIWTTHSGTAGDLLVSGGQVVVQHGVPSEDAHSDFAVYTSGTLYFGIDVSVADPGNTSAVTDAEYFAHFMDDGTDFTSRLGVESPATAGYRLSIGGVTDSEATWGSDLSFGTTYRVVVELSFTTGVSTLWVNPVSQASTSIAGNADALADISAFALRQSDSTWNEGITVDNLVVATTFDEALAIPEPASLALLGMGALAMLRRRGE